MARDKGDKHFEILEKESLGFGKQTFILRDQQTGVLYLFCESNYAGGLTPLLDSKGQPIVDKSDLDY